MPTIYWISDRLKQYSLEHFRMFAPLSLHELRSPSDNFCAVSDSLLSLISQYRDAVIRWFEERPIDPNRPAQQETLQFFTKQAIAFLHPKNQFLTISPQHKTLWICCFH